MEFEITESSDFYSLKDDWDRLYYAGRNIWHYSVLQSFECASLQYKSWYWNPHRLMYRPLFITVRTALGGGNSPSGNM